MNILDASSQESLALRASFWWEAQSPPRSACFTVTLKMSPREPWYSLDHHLAPFGKKQFQDFFTGYRPALYEQINTVSLGTGLLFPVFKS